MGSAILRRRWQGKWALVTGASAGIGEAIARELAEAGAHLILTARRAERLQALAEELGAKHSIQTQVVIADLREQEAPRRIFEATEGAGRTVDLLVNNAGFGEYGEFLHSNLDHQLSMVQVNCTAVVHLTRLFLPVMVSRARGDVMIVASTASFQPVPYLATYAATKVFDRFLAETLAGEVKRYGVRVSALCPGPTESEFSQVAGARTLESRKSQNAKEVAVRGLETLARGKPSVIPYWGGRIQVFA
ncbi:MAG TPA: SDR family oxidoreductase, partial [Acidobacteriaceae bacterium]|nr:SDR family oxidoreductase [Acidobacteriaceae bacterium]